MYKIDNFVRKEYYQDNKDVKKGEKKCNEAVFKSKWRLNDKAKNGIGVNGMWESRGGT